MEPITVILQTYRRTSYAMQTITAAKERLHYTGDLVWYVADDGSPIGHVETIVDAFRPNGYHSMRRGYGGNANAAWDAAQSDLTFWLEDDFVLNAPLDLTPHAYALMDCEALGMIRLGYINGERLEGSRSFAGRPYHTLPRDWPDMSFYAFTGHPSLRHRRYRDAYGDYPEGLGPGDTELAYAYQYRVGSGPLIVWPEGLPTEGTWAHIGQVKTETML